ncbi:thioredoxin family protein [Namhaeicola litoreus]|uniref:Thioredoxin family protein n=1 Tax=Namhaeicola litoreus TaxID=1052145 RepID=A0ABW3XY12_9FLAO
MKEIIENSLQKAMNYQEYRNHIQSLVNDFKVGEGADDLMHYNRLNDKRMKRLDKQINLGERAKEEVSQIENRFTWLVLSESWCGDAAQSLPVLNKFAEFNSNIDLKIVSRDENDSLMQKFLTNGSKSIPKLIVLDKNNEVIEHWGPRSKRATALLNEYKEKNGKIDSQIKEDLQIWYNKDKGQSIEEELVEVLQKMK